MRRNKFSSPTEVSKRAGLIAGSFLIAGPGGWRAAASRRFFWWRASRDRDRDGGTSSVARASALLPPCGRSLTCIRTNRQKAGKGFSQTGAACVVVTPHAREEAAAAATRRETEPEAAMREVAARARAPRGGRSTYRATRERGRGDQPANAPSGRAIAKNIALREKRRRAAARAILPAPHRHAAKKRNARRGDFTVALFDAQPSMWWKLVHRAGSIVCDSSNG